MLAVILGGKLLSRKVAKIAHLKILLVRSGSIALVTLFPIAEQLRHHRCVKLKAILRQKPATYYRRSAPVLLIISADLRKIFGLGSKAVIMFLTGTVGTSLAGL
ncbi:hypothetical protein O9929_23885 [Vibrio lentus]|nr:hypothetical protein [Vibrio lentus]